MAKTSTYSVHRDTAYGGVVWGLVLVTLFEGIAVHALTWSWSVWFSVVHGAIVVSSLIWLIGDYRAVAATGLRLGDSWLEIEIGKRWSARIPYTHIVDVKEGAPKIAEPRVEGRQVIIPKAKNYVAMTAIGGPTIHLVLREPLPVSGPLGVRREVDHIGLSPDEGASFVDDLRAKIDDARRSEPASATS